MIVRFDVLYHKLVLISLCCAVLSSRESGQPSVRIDGNGFARSHSISLSSRRRSSPLDIVSSSTSSSASQHASSCGNTDLKADMEKGDTNCSASTAPSDKQRPRSSTDETIDKTLVYKQNSYDDWPPSDNAANTDEMNNLSRGVITDDLAQCDDKSGVLNSAKLPEQVDELNKSLLKTSMKSSVENSDNGLISLIAGMF